MNRLVTQAMFLPLKKIAKLASFIGIFLLLFSLFPNHVKAAVDIDDSNANLTPFTCPATNRQRPYVADHTIKADNGYLLRGEHSLAIPVSKFGTESYLRSFRDDYNLNTIRLIAYRDLRVINGKLNWKTLEQITPIMDEQVRLAAKLGMYIIIDYHPLGADANMGKLDFWRQNSIDFWEQIAPRYKDCPHVIYEAWNELVNPGLSDAKLNQAADHFNVLHNIIRQRAPNTHTIVWSNMSAGDSLLRVKDMVPINYTKGSVGFHGYQMLDQRNIGDGNVKVEALKIIDQALARNDQIPYFMTEYTYPNGWKAPTRCDIADKYVDSYNRILHQLEDRKISWVMLNLKRPLEDHDFWKEAEINGITCNLPIPFDVFWPKDPKAVDIGSKPTSPTPKPTNTPTPTPSPTATPTPAPTSTPTPTPTTPPTTAPHPMPGDTNGDRIVNLVDYNQVLALFSSASLNADFNRNNIVDIFDINKTISFFPVNGSSPTPTATATPTPTSTPTPSTTPTPTTVPTATPPQGNLKTKKWNPGHYLRAGQGVTPEQMRNIFNEPSAQYMKGIRIHMHWGDFETAENVYTREILDQYLSQLPSGKKLIIKFSWRIQNKYACEVGYGLPPYIINHPRYPAVLLDGQDCIAQIWKPEIKERWIKANQKLAEYVDNDPRIEAIEFDETAMGIPPEYANRGQEFKRLTLEFLTDIHQGVAPYYQKTQVFQQMNSLGEGGQCGYLDELAEVLKEVGHGLGNPDSVPWRALPWDCNQPREEYTQYYSGLQGNDKPIAIYDIFRKNKGTMPIMVGGDTSFYEDPENPRTFNGEKMNYTNLVKYLYLTAVRGYTYKTTPPTNVSSLGGNYMLWNTHYSSIGIRENDYPIPVKEYYEKFSTAYGALISNPDNITNTQCPTNIKCQ